jgi:D-aspartate ligase
MRPAAIVTYMSYSGLGVIRSLGRRGIPVFALDPELEQIGMSSRFCDRRQCPSVEESEDANIEFLTALACSLPEKPVLFTTGDNTLHAYARREDVLRKSLRLTTPGNIVIRKTAEKDELFRTACDTGVAVPKTFAPNSSDEVRAIAASFAFPCLIKPIRSNVWHGQQAQQILREIAGGSEKSIVAETPEALLEAYRVIAAVDPRLIISEVIPGEDRDLLYFAFYRSADGRIWHFSGRKERVTPAHFGSASYVVSIQDADLERISIGFLEKLNYRGLGGLEFKRDARDGKLKLIELNARYGLWDALGQRCGVDTAYMAYLDAIGEKLPDPARARTGVKWISISRDLSALRGYRREGSLGIRDWVQTLAGEKMWAVFAWDDPLPAFTAMLRFSRRFLRYKMQSLARPRILGTDTEF